MEDKVKIAISTQNVIIHNATWGPIAIPDAIHKSENGKIYLTKEAVLQINESPYWWARSPNTYLPLSL